jgi:hypothetical protein
MMMKRGIRSLTLAYLMAKVTSLLGEQWLEEKSGPILFSQSIDRKAGDDHANVAKRALGLHQQIFSVSRNFWLEHVCITDSIQGEIQKSECSMHDLNAACTMKAKTTKNRHAVAARTHGESD